VTQHWFRHLLASDLMTMGDVKAVMEQGGWFDIDSHVAGSGRLSRIAKNKPRISCANCVPIRLHQGAFLWHILAQIAVSFASATFHGIVLSI
jgi:hypothetical protein